jgi:hypothetical protein
MAIDALGLNVMIESQYFVSERQEVGREMMACLDRYNRRLYAYLAVPYLAYRQSWRGRSSSLSPLSRLKAGITAGLCITRNTSNYDGQRRLVSKVKIRI